MTTIIQIIHRLRYFQNWLDENCSGVSLLQVQAQQARDYLDQFTSHSDYHRGSLHQFYRWCEMKKIVESNPFKKIIPVELPVELPICSKQSQINQKRM